jgi:methionine sulfoxide reductase catalytic subunit
MLIRRIPGWAIPERQATPEDVYLNRRNFLRGVGVVAAGLSLPSAAAAAEGQPSSPECSVKAQDCSVKAQDCGVKAADCSKAPDCGQAPAAAAAAPRAASSSGTAGAALYPAKRNPRYTLDRPLTTEAVAAQNNIFDEFASRRNQVWLAAKDFRTYPWRVQIAGQVVRPFALDLEELIQRAGGLEERLYRHRCVEAWAMAVPWTGFQMSKLVELAHPKPSAKYVRMVSVARAEQMPGWYATRRVFPFYEALSLAEATNELTFLATGIYGHPLPPQHGAPIRLVVPWKYGLKCIKSIASFEFTDERPGTFWNELSPSLYSFLSNVDPRSTSPWPQAEEEMLGTGERRPTLPYNGYGEWVAKLYT